MLLEKIRRNIRDSKYFLYKNIWHLSGCSDFVHSIFKLILLLSVEVNLHILLPNQRTAFHVSTFSKMSRQVVYAL